MDLFPIGSSVSHFIIAFDKRCFFLLFNNPASGFVLPSDSDYIGSTHNKLMGNDNNYIYRIYNNV